MPSKAKKLLLFITVIFLLKSIYADLTVGTPIATSSPDSSPTTEELLNELDIDKNNTEQGEEEEEKLPYEVITYEIKGGDTVLAVVEQLHPDGIPYSINKVLEDFLYLNPDTEPTRLKIGENYRFPQYLNQEEKE
ncbi:hypothetical protein RZN22_00985 [Bacillaceae bacterium S4-13-58]